MGVVGTVLIGGCLGVVRGEVRYDERREHEMFLEVSYFGDGWYEHPDINDFYDVVYGNSAAPEEVTDVVMTRIDIDDESEMAAKRMEIARQQFRGQNEYDLADEAFWAIRDANAAFAFFRHGNARGQVLAARERSTVHGLELHPWQQKAVAVSRAMYDRWRKV